MSSLTDHLRQAGSHGDLPFHSGCPVCRAERLAGTPPGDELLSARARAGLTAALLAATVTPAAHAMAGGGDTEQEGVFDEAPKAPAGEVDPGFDEGRGDTDLPAEDGLELPPAVYGEEVEQAPERENVPRESGPRESDPDVPGRTVEPPAVPPPPAPLPPITVPPEPPALEELQGPVRTRPDRDEDPPPETLPLETPGPPPTARPRGAPIDETESPATPRKPATGPGPAATPTAAGDAEMADPEGRRQGMPGVTGRGDRIHVVAPGECLWSIAYEEIGGNPPPAQVARLVNRLWELNRERIGTGDPDLLMAGTELRLP